MFVVFFPDLNSPIFPNLSVNKGKNGPPREIFSNNSTQMPNRFWRKDFKENFPNNS